MYSINPYLILLFTVPGNFTTASQVRYVYLVPVPTVPVGIYSKVIRHVCVWKGKKVLERINLRICFVQFDWLIGYNTGSDES